MFCMNKNPEHIGIILDGNRRFAKRLMLEPWKGHDFGYEKIRKLLNWCRELNIGEITLYCFSIQNFNRPKKEFDYLMGVFERAFKDLLKDKDVHKYKVRINFIGRSYLLPKNIQKLIKKAVDLTKGYNGYKVNIAIAYGGREEIVDAVKKVAEKVKNKELNIKDINEEIFAENLYMNTEPDIIIRTGGEKRTSNFLPWQSIYSEWVFLEKAWPEFEKEDLINVIEEYKNRERRFGE